MTAVEEQVRRRGVCEASGWLGLPCTDWLPLEVHELRGGYYFRRLLREYPEAMLLLCRTHHEHVDSNRSEAITAGLYWTEQQADQFLTDRGISSKVVSR